MRTSTRFRGSALRAAPLAALFAGAALACSEGTATAPSPGTDGNQLYWSLALNHHAVMLSTVAPYDTIRLVATPQTVSGEALTGRPAPTFSSSDPERVQVTTDGLVRGLVPGSGVKVAATLSADNVTHTDTVIINVTDQSNPPVLASFSAHPIPPDSAKVAVGGVDLFGSLKSLPIQAADPGGTPIGDLPVYFTSSDPTVATIDRSTGAITGVRPGHVTFYAATTAYGVTKTDTIPFTIGMPVFGTINVSDPHGSAQANEFQPAEVRIGVGGTIGWFNATQDTTDVTFEDPTKVMEDPVVCAFFGPCEGGNIEPFSLAIKVRRFPIPGTYNYRSTSHGTTGRIVVVQDS